jgi:hypothetical protein
LSERDELLASIAATISDYREGDLDAPTPQHVDSWVKQFDDEVQLPILRELDHVLKKTYFSRKRTIAFLESLFDTKKLVGDDPCAFWKSVAFLDIQKGGASQTEMLALFSAILKKKCGFRIEECGDNSGTFVYLDDGIFTGNRVRRDLESWISKKAPEAAKVHLITIAVHWGAYFYVKGKIKEAAEKTGKKIELVWWSIIKLEDRKTYTNSSDVLRPVSIPDDKAVQAYVEAMEHKPHLRTAGQVGGNGLYSSDKGRQLLEWEFLKAGVRIREQSPKLGDTQRPLGHMTLETLGFGSLVVTFRNCPNNAPLALWCGHPWYPLFPRATNSDTALKALLDNLAEDLPT